MYYNFEEYNRQNIIFMVYTMSTFTPLLAEVWIMKLLSMFFAPQRTLRLVDWKHCYLAIRERLRDEAKYANTNHLQELIDLLLLIEITLDINSIADLERYDFNYKSQTIRLPDTMWHIIRMIRPISEEEGTDEEALDIE